MSKLPQKPGVGKAPAKAPAGGTAKGTDPKHLPR